MENFKKIITGAKQLKNYILNKRFRLPFWPHKIPLWTLILAVITLLVIAGSLMILNQKENSQTSTTSNTENTKNVENTEHDEANQDNSSGSSSPRRINKPGPHDPYVDLHVEGVHNTEGESYYTEGGSKTRPMRVELIPRQMSLSDCSLSDDMVLDDDSLTAQTVSYQIVPNQVVTMEDGLHTLTLVCKSGAIETQDQVKVRVIDGQPKKCKNFTFQDSGVIVSDIAGLKSGVVGNWAGCVKTPWVPTYYVSVTLRADGTYSAVSNEQIDGQDMNAMYYGTEDNNPKKKYYINDFLADQSGAGEIDIVFSDSGTLNRGKLRNIKLMGDKLSFEFLHRSQYGPITFQLYKQ